MARYDWNEEKVREAVQKSTCYRDVLRELGINTSGNNGATLQRKIKEYGIDISHFTFRPKNPPSQKKTVYEYLKKGSKIHAFKLKEKLFKEGLKENRCEICGTDTWLGKKLICQLHHINGDNTDNRLENLQILCPNCHSQTDNYCGQANKTEKEKHYCEICGRELKWEHSHLCPQCAAKNRGKINLTKEEFIEVLRKHNGNKLQTSKELNVSETAVRKCCERFGLPKTSKELKKVLV